MIDSCKYPKKMWNFINKRLGKKQFKLNKIDYLVDSNGVKIVDNDKIAENMNDYFWSIGNKLKDSIISSTNERPKLPAMRDKTYL